MDPLHSQEHEKERLDPQKGHRPGLSEAWSGNVCFTRDLLPRATTLGGVHFAGGYGGHGVAMATYLGTLVAERLLGETDRNPFRDLPWAPIPAYDGRPWFLPAVGAYYALQDWLG